MAVSPAIGADDGVKRARLETEHRLTAEAEAWGEGDGAAAEGQRRQGKRGAAHVGGGRITAPASVFVLGAQLQRDYPSNRGRRLLPSLCCHGVGPHFIHPVP
jgi:hypothetical protein